MLYGGKTAIGVNPGGTSVRAVARVCGVAALAPTTEGGAPPPGVPGAAFPMKTSTGGPPLVRFLLVRISDYHGFLKHKN